MSLQFRGKQTCFWPIHLGSEIKWPVSAMQISSCGRLTSFLEINLLTSRPWPKSRPSWAPFSAFDFRRQAEGWRFFSFLLYVLFVSICRPYLESPMTLKQKRICWVGTFNWKEREDVSCRDCVLACRCAAFLFSTTKLGPNFQELEVKLVVLA